MKREGILAVDIGGTSTTADLVTAEGAVVCSRRRGTGYGSEALKTIGALMDEVKSEARRHGVEVRGVGVISPGQLDVEAGIVRFASNLGWRDVPLAEEVAARVDPSVPVRIGHDVRWAGIAEGTFGAARGCRDYCVLSIGTGIAACLVSDGHVLGGSGGAAGEVGHASVVADGEHCACGRRGCLDAYSSGAGMLRRYRRLSKGKELTNVTSLLDRIPGDPFAEQVWDEAVKMLARGLCTLTMTTDPALVVIVGGFSHIGESLTGPLQERLAAELRWKQAPRIAISPLSDLPGRAGAALLALTSAGRDAEAEQWSPSLLQKWRTARHPVAT